MGPIKLRVLTAASLLLALTGEPPPRGELAGPDLYRQTLRSTVLIVTPSNSKGTGWLLDREQRLVVTNFHVVGDQEQVDVFFPTYDEERLRVARSWYVENRRPLAADGRLVRGRVLHREKDCDLALIALPSLPDDARALPLAAASPVAGDTVLSIGNRGDLDCLWGCTMGTVRQVLRTQDGYFWHGQHLSKGATVIVTQSPINDGDSGGPLVNERGELVGVLAAVQWQAPLATIAIDVSEVRAFLAKKGTRTVSEPALPKGPRPLFRSTAWVKSGQSSNRATGWLLDRQRRLLVTTQHAVGSAEVVDAIFPVWQDGKVVAEYRFYRDNERLLRQRGQQVRGRVLARDARRNLALLELDALPEGVTAVALAASSARPGERVRTVGNPNGIEALWVCTTGTVRQFGHAGLGQTDEKPDPAVLLAQLPGSANDSGAAVVNDNGELVGVVTGKEAPQQLVGYCLDVGEVKAFLAEVQPRWDPRNAADYRQRGAWHARTGQHDRAVTAYDHALRLDPGNAVLLGERAASHRLKGDLDRALADCDEAVKADPRLPSGLWQRAAVRTDRGDLARALADCTAALNLDLKCAPALAQRGGVYRRRGDLDQALADCDEAIWIDQRLPEAYRQRGLVLAGKGDLDRALADLSRAVELDPYSALGHRLRGDVHRAKNEADKALADYTEALERTAQDALAFLGRGLALAMKDRHDAAIADFARALQLDSRLARASAGRGTSYLRKGEIERATTDYTRAIQLEAGLADEVLRDVQQRAAELGGGERADVAQCSELCRRTLVAFQKLFAPRADLRQLIADGLAAAEREPDVRERAQRLRAVVGEVRIRLR